jgi:uncharacterized protein (DUF1330 family)
MPAYVIAEVNVTDPKAYEEYRGMVTGTFEKFGGRFLARGGQIDSKEGSWKPERLVIVEFPSMEKARKWYDSPEYAPALALRLRAANARLILVEGV